MKVTYQILCLVLFISISACEDILEKPLQNSLTQESFPKSASDALGATNACYYVFREPGFNTGLFPIDDIMSDDAVKGSNPDDAASTIGPFDNFTFASTNGMFSPWWSTLYAGIKRTNVVINLVPDIEMDPDLKDNYIAQAKFVRAYLYFEAVRAWGGVPLILSTEPAFGATRATSDEIYAQIELDLTEAIPALNLRMDVPIEEQGRATKGAAQALLGKVYLYQKKFDEAAIQLAFVINSSQYSLEPDFENANSLEGEFGTESVFEIGAVDGLLEGIQNGTNFYANVQGVRGTPNRGWGFNRPSMDLMGSFESGDPRLESTVLYLGEIIDGETISGDALTPDETLDGDGGVIEMEVYNQKVWTPGSLVAPTQGHNRRLIRYADVLLMAAEAYNEIDNPTQALIYVEEVRARARGGNAGILPEITTTDKDLLSDAIMRERRHELALEGHRFWDLVRTGRAADVLGPLGYREDTHRLMPIPQSERDITQGSLSQNDNY